MLICNAYTTFLVIMLRMETSNILTCVWRNGQCIYRDQHSIYTLYINNCRIYIYNFELIYKRVWASKNNLWSKSIHKLVKILAVSNLLRESITSTNSNLLIISDNACWEVFGSYKLISHYIHCGLIYTTCSELNGNIERMSTQWQRLKC